MVDKISYAFFRTVDKISHIIFSRIIDVDLSKF